MLLKETAALVNLTEQTWSNLILHIPKKLKTLKMFVDCITK